MQYVRPKHFIYRHSSQITPEVNLLNVEIMQNPNDLVEHIWFQVLLKQLRIQGWLNLLGKNTEDISHILSHSHNMLVLTHFNYIAAKEKAQE